MTAGLAAVRATSLLLLGYRTVWESPSKTLRGFGSSGIRNTRSTSYWHNWRSDTRCGMARTANAGAATERRHGSLSIRSSEAGGERNLRGVCTLVRGSWAMDVHVAKALLHAAVYTAASGVQLRCEVSAIAIVAVAAQVSSQAVSIVTVPVGAIMEALVDGGQSRAPRLRRVGYAGRLRSGWDRMSVWRIIGIQQGMHLQATVGRVVCPEWHQYECQCQAFA